MLPVDKLIAIEHSREISEEIRLEGERINARNTDGDSAGTDTGTESGGTGSGSRHKRRDIESESREFAKQAAKQLGIDFHDSDANANPGS
jgi:hypothetical protein